jgi:hypothetical protein
VEGELWKGSFRLGGIAWLVAGVLYLALLGFSFMVGGEPATSRELLSQLASNAYTIRNVGVIFLLLELCLSVAFPILYIALQAKDKVWPLIATVFASTALLFDFISGLLMSSILPRLGPAYFSAPPAAQPAYEVVAELAYGYIWKVETPFHVALLSLAILIFSWVMRKGVFSKRTAYIGIAIGAVGIMGGLLGFFPIALLWPLWFLPTGVQLYRLGNVYPTNTPVFG